MKPPRFAYHAPGSLDEVVQLLAAHGGNARCLAGGQSLVPMLNFRIMAPAALIDLRKVPGLAGIRVDGKVVRIGAMTRQRVAHADPVIAEHLPLMTEALGWVGHLPTRSRGTIGGSIAHADPSAELPMTLLALDGTVVARGPQGERTIAADAFFDTFFTTALAPDEVLTEVRIPAMSATAGHAIEELARRKGDFAIVGIAAVVDGDGTRCTHARIVTAGIGGRPTRLEAAESILLRDGLGADAIAAAAAAATAAVEPTSDPVASADYRRHLAGVLTGRAVTRAVAVMKERRRA
jgi:carbon-monoxide dehydrogenase medium subunit